MCMNRMIGMRILFCIGCLYLTGCGLSDKNEKQSLEKTDIHEVQAVSIPEYPMEPIYKKEEERWEANRSRRQSVPEAFVSAYEEFAVNTASGLLADSTENMIYSPLSFYYALAVAAEGADGTTKEELLKLLGYADAEQLSNDAKAYFEVVYHVPNEENNKANEWGEYPSESRYTLSIANSLWADESVRLKDAFTKRASEYYYSEVYQGDLQSENTAKAMGEWVKEKTNGVLAPSFKENSQGIVLTLLNTVYFYDEWMDRFDKEKTKEDIFFCGDGSEVTAEFMNRTMGSHGFRKGDNFTASSLSLKNGSMEFYLPDEGVNVHDLIDTPEKMEALLNRSGEQMMGEVVWKVPKFSYGSSMNLVELLKKLGVENAFTSDADFSNISDMTPLFISKVKQDAHIGIDENGVEAAAFTEISWAGAALPQGRAEMILNRPFFYVIRNKGKIVFMGVCEKVREE